ncbi:uncharacterized protein ACA1_372640 [Acanthamoeba castellanii str. Neff]|uniref:Mediator of RNA polymerase II transcription subunit 10 n=1 Tax=Acanthamoeba castellanii (strain ATCC 30010 / Neff) TaxID=1257118 RepID=L8GGR4_ACACF|nr:uncharacterized protein ACA1_372640 [Acanthamoeba castellanii str. Neff]ELR12275.1 hypothetical protein ACA1_372640 [Acanthamoeba castellanii str. Neff]
MERRTAGWGGWKTFSRLSIIVEDYHEHQPPTFLFDKINGFVEELAQLDRARHEHANVDLPMQIFQFIDEGKNPDLYVQESLLERCLERNERTRGKLHLLQRLKDELALGAAQLPGDDMEADPTTEHAT